METFKKRSIDVLFSLRSGSKDGEVREVSFSGLRVSARIHYMAGAYSQADIQIYGLSQDFMRQLICIDSHAWTGGGWVDNRITLRYTDKTNVTIFEGGITAALIDYNTVPDVPLSIMASETKIDQLSTTAALSFPGSVPVETIIRRILARGSGTTFENRGVTTSLTDETVNGSIMDMIGQVCRHARVDYWKQNNVLIIAPIGAEWQDMTPIDLSPENGLVGWPVLMRYGCHAVALFSPDYVATRSVRLACPALFEGTQTFFIQGLTHEVDSDVPGGRWHTRLILSLNTANAKKE